MIWLATGFIGLALLLLIISANYLVDGATALANRLHIPPFIIGVILIGFGTSAPEVAISITAASAGNSGIAIGNGLGSNIVNLGLVITVVGVFKPIVIDRFIVQRQMPLLIAVTGLIIVLASDLTLNRWDAAILLVGFVAFIIWLVKSSPHSPLSDAKQQTTQSLLSILSVLATSLVVLISSSKLLVWAAVIVANNLGFSETVIGLTVVAIGTSLPELSTTLTAIKKNQHQIAVGNIVGSNIFNTLLVIGITIAIKPHHFSGVLVYRDLSVMGLLTIAFYLLIFRGWHRDGLLNRFASLVILVAYISYTVYLIVVNL